MNENQSKTGIKVIPGTPGNNDPHAQRAIMSETDLSAVTKQDLINTRKHIDQSIAKFSKIISDLEARLDTLDKHSSLHRDMIYSIHLHLSKKDRIAFDKRYYER